jgi:non-heme chloroperoxidase
MTPHDLASRRRTVSASVKLWPVLSLTLSAAVCLGSNAQPGEMPSVRVNGVELYYLERGKGEPVVFVHGALDDYRMWEPEIEPFAERYRLVDYSRRYSFPNQNGWPIRDYSATTDADDLGALIHELRLGPVHVVAHSYGGYAALFLAVRHPELVRSLVLAEPAVLCWARDNPEVRLLFRDQIEKVWQPARDAFLRADPDGALRVALDYFEGKGAYDRLPEGMQNQLKQDLPEWRALTLSREAFPALAQNDIAKLDKSVLLLTGDNTPEIFKFIDRELQRSLRRSAHVLIANARHEMWADNEQACRRATLQFLSEQKEK